jgi:hypothetical protein
MNTANRVRLAHCEERVGTRKAPDCRSAVSPRWLLKEPPPFRPSLLMKKALRHTAMLPLPHRERCGCARREQPPLLCCAQAGRDSRGASHLRARKSWSGLGGEESATPPMAGVASKDGCAFTAGSALRANRVRQQSRPTEPWGPTRSILFRTRSSPCPLLFRFSPPPKLKRDLHRAIDQLQRLQATLRVGPHSSPRTIQEGCSSRLRCGFGYGRERCNCGALPEDAVLPAEASPCWGRVG